MPESPLQWLSLAAIPLLLVAGGFAVLHWARYIGTLTSLRHPAPDASAVARLRLAGEEHYRRAYRHSWQVVAVVALGMGAALLVPLLA
ncbi:hypothetical protein ACH9EU_10525 [Kocuria sp. M1R5S2]|uniref:hypothetical protein n=1 Tax=Kocuria rhizosphaerae TaxID=3376285 RepID=UPI0037968ABE